MNREPLPDEVQEDRPHFPGAETSSSLADLAATINWEHHAVVRAARDAVEHAIWAGEALLAAKDRVAHGEWRAWIEQNCDISYAHATSYMRLATYGEQVRAAPVGDSITRALNYLRGLPPTTGTAEHSDELRIDAVWLTERGVDPMRVAEVFGVSVTTVRRWTDSAFREREKRTAKQRERRRRRRLDLIQRGEVYHAARRTSDDVAAAYALLRKCAQTLHRATEDEKIDREARAALADAMPHLYRAEDEIARALRVPPPPSSPKTRRESE